MFHGMITTDQYSIINNVNVGKALTNAHKLVKIQFLLRINENVVVDKLSDMNLVMSLQGIII